MNPGKLNKRALFQRRHRSPVGGGSSDEIWEDAFSVWASIRVLAPQHRNFMNQPGTFEPNWIIIRKDRGRIPKVHMRAIIDGQKYNILTVREYTSDPKYWEIEAMGILP